MAGRYLAKMEEELFTLKWNNHQTAFLQIIRNLRSTDSHTDATLACEGKLFSVHKFVLSTCSAYFGEIFEKTSCKHPVVILKDIDCKNLEYILDYMYIGEVNVRQTELASLVSVAECLRIKGLAVPDEVAEASSKSNYSGYLYHQSTENEKHERRIGSVYTGDNGADCSPKPTVEHHSVKLEEEISEGSGFFMSMQKEEHSKIKFEPVEGSPKFSLTSESHNFEITSNFDRRNSSSADADAESNSLPDYYSLNESTIEGNEDAGGINVAGPSTIPLGMQSSDLNMNVIQNMAGGLSERVTNSQSRLEPTVFIPGSHIYPTRSYGLKRLKKRFSQFSAGKSNFPRSRKKVNYICPHCSYTCQDNSNFKRHVQIHTGEKPYHCPFCRYSTIHSSNLKSHIRSKHSSDLMNRSSSVDYCLPTKGHDENYASGMPRPVIPPSVPPSV